MASVELSELGGAVRAALMGLAGEARLPAAAVHGLPAAAAPAYASPGALLATREAQAPGAVLLAAGHRYLVAAAPAADHHLTTAGGVKLYVLPGAEGWNPLAFGAAWDGATNDTAAIQAALDAACAASGNNGDGAHSIVHFPAGMARANGLVVKSHNVRISGWGCMLKSFAPQAAPQYLLAFLGGGFDEGQLIVNNAIYGLALNGANHANVHGLHLSGVAHFHYWHARIRSFGGAGGGCGLRLDNAYDCVFWGGYVDWCGRDGGSAAASTAAVQIASSTIDSCNQVYFKDYTWEANAGLDVALIGPEGNPFPNNALSFESCKWEQSGARKVYAGVYAPQAVQNAVTFEGKGYVAGYHRDGGWLDMTLSASAKIVVSPSYDFGYKTDQPPSGTPPATIKLRGLGKALLGGRLSDARIATIPWLDTETKEPTDIQFSDVSTAGTSVGRAGWLWKTKDGSASRCQVDQGRLVQVFKLAANEAASFFPRGESGLLSVMMHDRPAAMAMLGLRCESGGVASLALLSGGAEVELGTGLLTTGDTATTANRIHVRVHTDGRAYVQNRFSFSAAVYLHLAPTIAF